MEDIKTEEAAQDVIKFEPEVKGNGNLKRKHGVDASSDDENDFLGFDTGQKNLLKNDLIRRGCANLRLFSFSRAKR